MRNDTSLESSYALLLESAKKIWNFSKVLLYSKIVCKKSPEHELSNV